MGGEALTAPSALYPGDSMSYHSGSVFSARDRDPNNLLISCAVSYRGAWWYRNCHYANLNGLYGSTVDHQVRGCTGGAAQSCRRVGLSLPGCDTQEGTRYPAAQCLRALVCGAKL